MSTYTGVREFSSGGWCAVTKSNGVLIIIYTADTAEECASAYDQYLTIVKPRHWERSLNNVAECHDFGRLWDTIALVGAPNLRGVARTVQERLQEYLKQHKETPK